MRCGFATTSSAIHKAPKNIEPMRDVQRFATKVTVFVGQGFGPIRILINVWAFPQQPLTNTGIVFVHIGITSRTLYIVATNISCVTGEGGEGLGIGFGNQNLDLFNFPFPFVKGLNNSNNSLLYAPSKVAIIKHIDRGIQINTMLNGRLASFLVRKVISNNIKPSDPGGSSSVTFK